MAAQTGRTVSKFLNLVIADSTNTLRDIGVQSLSVCGVTYEEQDLTVFQDAVMGALPNMPDAPIEFTTIFDTTAAQAASGSGVAPALSGSHTVLAPLNGAMTPRTIDVQMGIRHTWETGEPQFGLTATDTSGYIMTQYNPNFDDQTVAVKFVLHPGSSLPAWGTAAEAAS